MNSSFYLTNIKISELATSLKKPSRHFLTALLTSYVHGGKDSFTGQPNSNLSKTKKNSSSLLNFLKIYKITDREDNIFFFHSYAIIIKLKIKIKYNFT